MEYSNDIKNAWKNMMLAWAAGNTEGALAILANLVDNASIEKPDIWRHWGDTAVALKDLRLATHAYKKARYYLPANLKKKWLCRYLYTSLQTGGNPLEILREYNSSTIAPENTEDGLIRLALEADLHYRLGNIPQAAVVAKDMLDQWLDAADTAFEFFEHIQNRLWLLLTRLAEEAGNASVANQFLRRIESARSISAELQPIINMLRILLGLELRPNNYNSETDKKLVLQLKNILFSDFSSICPPVSESLRKSLEQTLIAIQSDTNQTALLEKAVKSRRTNVLARYLYIEKRKQHNKSVEHIIASEANLWMTLKLYKEEIRDFLTSSSEKTDSEFSFVALGGGGHIGGSSYLLDINGTNLLLDIGLDIGISLTASYKRLKRNLAQSDIISNLAELDAVLISHAHLDHIGLLPALYTDTDLPNIKIASGIVQPKIPFYASDATREIARIMLENSYRLSMSSNIPPLYTLNDVASSVDALKPPRDGLLDLFSDLGKVKFLESSHILGSKMILLEKDNFKVLFTGDFNTREQITLPPSAPVQDLKPDVLIMESTYGYNAHEWMLPRSWQEQAFIAHLDRVLRRGGIVLLPAFAVGRSQEILGVVAKHLENNRDIAYNIYLDGLSQSVTECYDKFDRQLPDHYRGFRTRIGHRLVRAPNNTNRATFIKEQVLGHAGVIIASSGMLQEGSASYQYAEHIAKDPKNAIFYTGYLSDDSEAAKFLGKEIDHLSMTKINVQCEQRRFHFSAHAPKGDMLQFALDVQPRAVILVHGDTSKNIQVTNNLYALLKQLESDSFHVFLGKEGHKIGYSKRRFDQNE